MKKEAKVLVIRCLPAPVIGLSFIARFYAGGWLLPFGLVVYSTIGLFHCLVHYRAVRPTERISWPIILAIALSHVLFVSAFLLQYDFGDGPGWLTITLLLRGFKEDPIEGTLWGQHFVLMNLFVFIPVFFSWYPLKRDKETT